MSHTLLIIIINIITFLYVASRCHWYHCIDHIDADVPSQKRLWTVCTFHSHMHCSSCPLLSILVLPIRKLILPQPRLFLLPHTHSPHHSAPYPPTHTHTHRYSSPHPHTHPAVVLILTLTPSLLSSSGAVDVPKRPFAAIVGGSKVSSKISVIEAMLSKVRALNVR